MASIKCAEAMTALKVVVEAGAAVYGGGCVIGCVWREAIDNIIPWSLDNVKIIDPLLLLNLPSGNNPLRRFHHLKRRRLHLPTPPKPSPFDHGWKIFLNLKGKAKYDTLYDVHEHQFCHIDSSSGVPVSSRHSDELWKKESRDKKENWYNKENHGILRTSLMRLTQYWSEVNNYDLLYLVSVPYCSYYDWT